MPAAGRRAPGLISFTCFSVHMRIVLRCFVVIYLIALCFVLVCALVGYHRYMFPTINLGILLGVIRIKLYITLLRSTQQYTQHCFKLKVALCFGSLMVYLFQIANNPKLFICSPSQLFLQPQHVYDTQYATLTFKLKQFVSFYLSTTPFKQLLKLSNRLTFSYYYIGF